MNERDRLRTPWGWLQGFAWFLLAWPLFGLLALGEMEDFDWDSILLGMLGPAAIGLVLLLIDRVLTKFFGVIAATAGQAVPGLLRDISNLGLTLAVLMGINVALVMTFEKKNLFTRPDLDAGPIAAYVLAACFGTTVVFRALHRLRHGPARHEDMGEGWDVAPNMLRLFGYLALIPMLLVCTVMIDYTLRSRPGFGLTAWIVLPAILWLGLRSAMARSPRYWARNPWEAWRRAQSLAFPWWVIGFVVGAGTCAGLMIAPVAMADDEITFAGRIIVGVLLGPIGAFGIYVAGKILWLEIPLLVRRWRVTRRLAKDPTILRTWDASLVPAANGAKGSTYEVRVFVQGGREVPFPIDGPDAPLVQWLRTHG